MAGETYQVSHLATRLESLPHPIFLRVIEDKDAETRVRVFAETASDPVSPEEIQKSRDGIARFRESATEPTTCRTSDDTVLSGPSRINLSVMHRAESTTTTAADGELPDGVMIGMGGFGAIKNWQRDGKPIRAGDCGVIIQSEYRGRGYAAEAMKLSLDFGFAPARTGGLQLDLCTITTLRDNEAMIKLADEKLGLKGKGQEIDDEGNAAMYYELTSQDWEEAKAKLS